MNLITNTQCPVYLLGFIGGILEQVTTDDVLTNYVNTCVSHLDIFTTSLSSVDEHGCTHSATIGIVDNTNGLVGVEAPFMYNGPLKNDYGINNYLFSAFTKQLEKPYKNGTYASEGMVAVNDKQFSDVGRLTVYYSSKYSKDPYWVFITVIKIKV